VTFFYNSVSGKLERIVNTSENVTKITLFETQTESY